MHRSQRTGAVTWRTRRCSISRPWMTAAPSRFDSMIRAGSATVTPPATAARACLGRRHVRRVERARHLQRDDPGLGRRLVGELGQRVQRARGDDLAGAVAVGRVQARACRSRRCTSSGSPPSTALIPVGSSAQAAAISRPRTPASVIAASAGSTPASAAAPSSPTLWPATRPTSYIGRCSAASRAAATSSGWVRAVSLISSASACGAEVDQVDPGQRGPPAQPGLGAGEVEPRREEAGLLGALAGREYGEHVLDSSGSAGRCAVAAWYETLRPAL